MSDMFKEVAFNRDEINRKQRDNYRKRRERAGFSVTPAPKRHGMTYTRTWRAWRDMRSRVFCPSDSSYERYKGCTIDKRWDDFLSFLGDMGECPSGLTLDRIDNDKGYSKGNCRWATRAQQVRNRRITRLSEEKVREIRCEYKSVPNYILAEKYNVSRPAISAVKHGRTWKEVANV